MRAGIERVGDTVVVRSALQYRAPDEPTAVFYGLAHRLHLALKQHAADLSRRAVYIDLGYWGRRDGGRFLGFHKISVDARHPTAYFQRRSHDSSRIEALGQAMEEWRGPGRHILLAGMGPKAALVEGFPQNGWERDAIAQIRKVSDRPIIFRPKPSDAGAQPVAGTTFDRTFKTGPLAPLLENCHAIVTHHSNVGVEALQAGVPVFTAEGVALPLGLADLSRIETPKQPSDAERMQWLADVAWCQWSVAEMAEGLPWRHLKDEGLVP